MRGYGLMIMPDGHWCLLDEDEFFEAKESGDIIYELFHHDYVMAQCLISQIELDYRKLLDLPFNLLQQGGL